MPFRRQSSHGVVYCDYLNTGMLEGAREAALAHYGSEEALEGMYNDLLQDACKSCGVNNEWME